MIHASVSVTVSSWEPPFWRVSPRKIVLASYPENRNSPLFLNSARSGRRDAQRPRLSRLFSISCFNVCGLFAFSPEDNAAESEAVTTGIVSSTSQPLFTEMVR